MYYFLLQSHRSILQNLLLFFQFLLLSHQHQLILLYNTERQLCLNLQEWAERRTVLFITHRLSSIRNSDLILVMHDGRLVEQGNHLELMQAGERYAVMYQQQGD